MNGCRTDGADQPLVMTLLWSWASGSCSSCSSRGSWLETVVCAALCFFPLALTMPLASPTWQDYELFVEAVEQNTLQQFLKLA